MPIKFSKQVSSKSNLLVWSIEEKEAELLNMSCLSPREEIELNKTTHPQKRLEFLSGKLCIKTLVEQTGESYEGIYKDQHGKPHLINKNYHISVSHSYPYACAVLNQKVAVGIDIERPKEKLNTIARKFLNNTERDVAGTDIDKLCILWSAKESVYKEYGKKKLIFKDNIRIDLSENYMKNGLNAKLELFDITKSYKIGVLNIEDHILCYTI